LTKGIHLTIKKIQKLLKDILAITKCGRNYQLFGGYRKLTKKFGKFRHYVNEYFRNCSIKSKLPKKGI
jgi:hypothetical protein